MKKSKCIDLKTPEGRQQFYQTKEWRAMRNHVLTFQPYCQECLKNGVTTLGNEVDHIIDIKDDPTKCLDIGNLQVLCKSCHSKKTMLSNMYGAIHTKYTSKHKKWGYII